MTDGIVILSTVSSQEEGDQIATKLVNDHIAACVNIIPKISSIYHWQGKVHKDEELLLIIKTIQYKEAQVYDIIKDMHSYDTPELITLDMKNIDDKYANWLNSTINETP